MEDEFNSTRNCSRITKKQSEAVDSYDLKNVENIEIIENGECGEKTEDYEFYDIFKHKDLFICPHFNANTDTEKSITNSSNTRKISNNERNFNILNSYYESELHDYLENQINPYLGMNEHNEQFKEDETKEKF